MEIIKQGYKRTCFKSELKFIRLHIVGYVTHRPIQRSDLVCCCCVPLMCAVSLLNISALLYHLTCAAWLFLYATYLIAFCKCARNFHFHS